MLVANSYGVLCPKLVKLESDALNRPHSSKCRARLGFNTTACFDIHVGQECVHIIGKSDISTLVDSVLAVILLRENLICNEGCNGLQCFTLYYLLVKLTSSQ